MDELTASRRKNDKRTFWSSHVLNGAGISFLHFQPPDPLVIEASGRITWAKSELFAHVESRTREAHRVSLRKILVVAIRAFFFFILAASENSLPERRKD